MKVYIINFCDRYSIYGPAFGCWWNTVQITSFRAIFLLFAYILKFVSFLLENKYGDI